MLIEHCNFFWLGLWTRLWTGYFPGIVMQTRVPFTKRGTKFSSMPQCTDEVICWFKSKVMIVQYWRQTLKIIHETTLWKDTKIKRLHNFTGMVSFWFDLIWFDLKTGSVWFDIHLIDLWFHTMPIRSGGCLRTYVCFVLVFYCLTRTNCHEGKLHHLQKR